MGAATQRKPRSLLVLWHRWFGILAGLWLLLMAVTGSILVFYGELDRTLNQDLRVTSNTGTYVPVSQMVTAAENHRPGSTTYFLNLPNQAGETAQVFLSFPDTDQRRVNVFIDPYTGEVLGERTLGVVGFDRRHIMNLIYDLHLDLMMGEWMLAFLGLVAFLWLLDHFLVLWISFPAARNWFRSFLIRSGAKGFKFSYDLHRASGLWLFPVTLMLAVSSLYFNWYPGFVAVVDRISPVTQRYIFTMEPQPDLLNDPQISFADAVETAEAHTGNEVDIVNYYPNLHTYLARAFDERDIDSHGRRMITIDAQSGDIVDDSHAASGSAGDVFLLWQYSLHSGKAFGWPGRLIIFVSGIALTIMCVTGLQIWWRKRRGRRRPVSSQL